MESDIARAALDSLNPLFKLRYSASHRQLYNLIYRLTPIDDYNPDWAIVFHVQDAFGEVREKLYLVRETKGTDDLDWPSTANRDSGQRIAVAVLGDFARNDEVRTGSH